MKFWRFKKKWIEAVLAFAMTAVLARQCLQDVHGRGRQYRKKEVC